MPGVILVSLLAAAVITLLACLIILAIYRRSIRRIIKLEPRQTQQSSEAVGLVPSTPNAEVPALLITARSKLERLAAVYSAAGIACAGLLTLAFLLEASAKSYMGPFVFLTIYSWPVVLCWNQVSGRDSRTRRRRYLVYAAVLASLWLVNIILKPTGNAWSIPYAFVLANAVPTLLIFCFASPAVRTIGPCIFSFSFVFVLGGWSAVHFVETSRSAVPFANKWNGALLVTVCFAVFLPIACAWLALLIRGYARNRFSDLSMRIDSIWLTVAISQGVFICTSSATGSGRGVAFAILAFPAYWLIRILGLRRIRDSQSKAPDSRMSLLYLRRFALRGRTERLFEIITHSWRPIGDVVLIGGPDLARSTIQPHSLVQFLLRRTKLSLISSEGAMKEQIARLPGAVDPDTRSRITDFLCANDMWKETVRELMGRADKVIADFRDLNLENTGSLYEIEQMVCRVQVDGIVIVTDGLKSKSLIEQEVSKAWKKLTSESANWQRRPEELTILVQADSDRRSSIVLNRLFSLPGDWQEPGRAMGQAN